MCYLKRVEEAEEEAQEEAKNREGRRQLSESSLVYS